MVVPIPGPKTVLSSSNRVPYLLARWWRSPQRVLQTHGLHRRGHLRSQKQLSKKERKKNIRGVFSWDSRVPIPETVMLVDDVCTTGATLEEAARVLKKRGVKRVWAWTLLRAPPIFQTRVLFPIGEP